MTLDIKGKRIVCNWWETRRQARNRWSSSTGRSRCGDSAT